MRQKRPAAAAVVVLVVGDGGGCGGGRRKMMVARGGCSSPDSVSYDSSDALGQPAGLGRRRRRHHGRRHHGRRHHGRRRRHLCPPRRFALRGLFDRLGRRHEHGVDEVDDGGAGGHVGLRDLGDGARFGLDGDGARFGLFDGEFGLGEPGLDGGSVGELGGLKIIFLEGER